MRKTVLVARRELAVTCGAPLGWILAAIFVLLTGYFFYSDLVLFVLVGYLGLALLGAAFVACGVAASTITENQVVAAMVTYGVLMLGWFATWNEAAIGERLATVLLQLSLFDHFYGFAQGVVDSRDIVYLLAFAALFLFLAHRSLGARAWRGL